MGTWVYTNKKVLRIAAVTLAALALAFWGQPTGKTILVLAGLLLAALALIEFSASHPNAPPRSPPDVNHGEIGAGHVMSITRGG